MSSSVLPRRMLKRNTLGKVATPLLWLLLMMCFTYSYSQEKLLPEEKEKLRKAYQSEKNPEISFEKFVELNAHIFTLSRNQNTQGTANRDAQVLAPQDTYCAKVRPYCSNGNFEDGLDQDKWTGAYGTWNVNSLYPNPFGLTYGFSSGALGSSAARQTIVEKSAGNDPFTGIPLVAANGGNRALRLGNSATGYGTEIIAKTLVVDPNETILSFYYAVVFQDPNHALFDQPAFSVRAYDCATGLELPGVADLGNGTNIVVSDASNPFFQSASSGSIAYRDWSLAQINLSAHVGKTVIIVFTNLDCGQGGHFGYTYLDNIFSNLCPVGGPILTGQGSVSLNATNTNNCGLGQICIDYTLPTSNNNTGTTNITLDIYQNGVKVTTLNSPTLSSGTSYCFAIDPSSLGLNTALGGFDYAITGTFSLSGFALAPLIVGSPPNGQIPNANNDYMIMCAVANVYYSKAAGDLHNLSTWGVNPDGSGANPADFGSGKTFMLANRGSAYSMTGNWTVGGIVNIPSGSQLQINGNTLSITDLAGNGTITGSAASNLVVMGTEGGNLPLNFTSGGQMLNDFTLNRMGTGGTASLGSPLHVFNVLTVSNGTLNTGNQLTLKSTATNTARVAPLAAGSISGNVTVERYIPARRAWRILAAPVGGVSNGATGGASLTHSQETSQGTFITSTGGARPMSFGTASFSLNAAQTELSISVTVFNIDINGLQTPADNNDNLVAAHIHVGAPPGVNAPVRWGFFGTPDNDVNPKQLVVTPFGSGVGGTLTSTWDVAEGNAGTTLTSNLPAIFAGQSYVNFHTVQFPGGEIRGQIYMAGAGTQTINQAWQEGAILGVSPNPNPFPGYGTHITGGPIFGSAANGFDQNPAGGASSIRTYNSALNTWVDHPNTNATPVGSNAFWLFVRGDRSINLSYNNVPPTPTTLRASGPLKIGDQTFPVSGSGFTAIPNPFASPINFATITRNGVQNNFYVWDPKMGSTGAYVLISFNGVSYDVIPASVSPESQYIQSGQGFLVRPSAPGTAGSITIKESDKSATPAQDVFRIAGGGRPSGSIAPEIADPTAGQGVRIRLQSANQDRTVSVADEVFVSYQSNFSDKLDLLDAQKLANLHENLAIISEGETLMAERRSKVREGDVLKLKLWNTTQQAYTFEINPIGLLGLGMGAVLDDKFLNTSLPVSLVEKTQVHFAITSDPASARTDRFQLRIVKGGLENVFIKNAITAFPNPVVNRNISLWFDNKAAGKYDVTIVNSMGQVIFRKIIQHTGGSAMQTLQLDRQLLKGAYQLKVEGNNELANISLISNQ